VALSINYKTLFFKTSKDFFHNPSLPSDEFSEVIRVIIFTTMASRSFDSLFSRVDGIHKLGILLRFFFR